MLLQEFSAYCLKVLRNTWFSSNKTVDSKCGEGKSALYNSPTSVTDAGEYVAAMDGIRPRSFSFVC